MPIYVSLMKLTDQGITTIKDAPARLEENIKDMEAMGGKLMGFYLTMGEYDYVAIAEWPSDEAAMTFLLRLGFMGDMRTTTLKAFTPDESTGLFKKLS